MCRGDPHAIGRRIRALCRQYGISDRVPWPSIPGDKRALNRRVVEAFAKQCYGMEWDNVPGQRIWAYRKATWAIEDLQQNFGLVNRSLGRKESERIGNVGRGWQGVEKLFDESVENPPADTIPSSSV